MPLKHAIEEHMAALRHYAIRLTRNADSADELVQETILKILNRPHAPNPENPKAYLMRTLRNQFIDQTRSVKRRPSVPIDDLELEAPDADQAEKMTARQVVAAMAALPQDLADILSRLAEHQQTYAEIAADLNIPIGTVMSRLSRARASLRMKLCGSPTANCI